MNRAIKTGCPDFLIIGGPDGNTSGRTIRDRGEPNGRCRSTVQDVSHTTPIWTPLIPSTFAASEVETFGSTAPMKRAGQPFELAPAYVYLASSDSTHMTGQVLHVNGGTVVNG